MAERAVFDPTEFGLPEHAECPFCGGTGTHLVSPFGPQLSVATYWCRECHTAFEVMKWQTTSRPPASDAH